MNPEAKVPIEVWRGLYDYWKSLPIDRSQLDRDPPADLPELAPQMMIVEIDGRAYRYLYFGSEVAAKIGQNLTGKSIGGSSLVEQLKISWQELLGGVARLRMPRLMHIGGDGGTNNYLLMLPLFDDEKRVKRVLAGVFLDKNAGSKIIIRRWEKLELPEE